MPNIAIASANRAHMQHGRFNDGPSDKAAPSSLLRCYLTGQHYRFSALSFGIAQRGLRSDRSAPKTKKNANSPKHGEKRCFDEMHHHRSVYLFNRPCCHQRSSLDSAQRETPGPWCLHNTFPLLPLQLQRSPSVVTCVELAQAWSCHELCREHHWLTQVAAQQNSSILMLRFIKTRK